MTGQNGHHRGHGHGRNKGLDSLQSIGSYEAVLEVFRKYDANGDRLMDFHDVHKLLLALNRGSWKESDSSELFAEMDRDKSGAIDVNEFVEYIFRRPPAMGGTGGMSEYESILELFRKYDTDRNGTLNKHEFTRLMAALKAGWTWQHTEAVFREVDKDNNGEIDSAELMSYIMSGGSSIKSGSGPSTSSGGSSSGSSMSSMSQNGQEHKPRKKPKTLVIDFVCGTEVGPRIQIKKAAKTWQDRWGERISVSIKEDPHHHGFIKVSAMDGAVVFWDRPSMIAYREDPFATVDSTRNFFEDLSRSRLQGLLDSLAC